MCSFDSYMVMSNLDYKYVDELFRLQYAKTDVNVS